MLSPLLATKLYLPPARVDRVPRPRLNEKLNIMPSLTVVAAPAGFGKTTALSEGIHQSEHCIAWASLDEGDHDQTRFWIYIIAALQRLRADLGESALMLLQLPQPPLITSVLTTLIKEIAGFPEEFSIVLDDYHRIKSRPIHERLVFLIDYLPSNIIKSVAGNTLSRGSSVPVVFWLDTIPEETICTHPHYVIKWSVFGFITIWGVLCSSRRLALYGAR